jgi:hypothetical protein
MSILLFVLFDFIFLCLGSVWGQWIGVVEWCLYACGCFYFLFGFLSAFLQLKDISCILLCFHRGERRGEEREF